MKRPAWRLVAVFALYTLFTIIFNYPLLVKISRATYGYVGDNYGYLWQLWWWSQTPRTLIDGALTPLLGAPVGGPVNYYLYEPLLIGVGRLLTLFVNYFSAFNLLLLVTFPLTGLTTYILVKSLTHSDLSGLVAGYMFAFCPYHFWQSYAHFSLAQTQWLPLYLLALIRVTSGRGRQITSFLFLLLAFFLLFFTSFIYGYFALVLTGLWLLVDLGYRFLRREKYWSWKFLISMVIFFSLAGLVSFFYFSQFTRLETELGVTHEGRDLDHALALSARPWDYLLPAYDHPFFGRYISDLRDSFWRLTRDWRMASPFKPESILFLGFTPLFLALVGVLGRKREGANGNQLVSRLVWVAFGFFLLSLPPYLPLGGVRLYFPSFLLFKVFPTYRVMARLGVLVMLMVSVLAGFGLKPLLSRFSYRVRYLLLPLICSLIVWEFLNVPPFHWTDFSQIPSYYSWLREQPGDFIVADYPIEAFDFAEAQLWQTFHGKPILNGSSEWATARLWRDVADLKDPAAVAKLKELGVHYVIYHVDDYLYGGEHPVDGHRSKRFSTPPDSPEKSGLKLLKSESGSVILEVL